MAKKGGNPQNLKPPFPKGVSGNPSGKPKGIITRGHIEATMGRFCNMTRAELQEVVADKKSTMLEIMVASIMAKSAQQGDHQRFEALMQRMVGKVQDKIEMSTAVPFVIRRPSGETVELGVEQAKEIEE